MLKLRSDLIGLAPFMSLMIYLWGRTTWATARYGGYPFLASLGCSFLLIGILMFVMEPVRTCIPTRWFLMCFGFLLFIIGTLFAIAGQFEGMYYLMSCCWFEGIYGVAIGFDIYHHHLWYFGKNQPKSVWVKPTKHQIIGLALVGCFWLAGIFGTLAYQFDSRTTLQFTVTASEMQNKELTLYWVNPNPQDPQALVNVLKETNTILALQGHPDMFLGNGSNYNDSVNAANLVRLCNQAGVKVEIWPSPSADFFCGLSLRYVDCMATEYQYFKDWVQRNNITVTYYGFDIEDSDSWTPFANTTIGSMVQGSFMAPVLGAFYNLAAKQEFLRVNRSDWTELLAKQQSLINQIRADGYIPRATVNPDPLSALDGDLSNFIQNYEESYEITGYQYLSQMIYRGCSNPDNASTYYLYQNVRLLHEITTFNETAVDIGCIGYTPYLTSAQVANDVWLSVANGADAVRIFLGDSWVYSAPTEAQGFQNLLGMLTLCRQGGVATTSYSAQSDMLIFPTVLADVLGDL